MSFLKRLFGGGAAAEPEPQAEEYNGFTLTPTPYQEAGQWQMCGVITREVDGVVKEHRFVRADRFPSREDAVAFTLAKARQIVDLNGNRIFS
jgi:hypothetical protein